MIISGLQFENYRNLKDGYIEPCENVNIIYGENAQGKTNLLELIWLFCGGHSFRGSKDSELIKFGEKFARIKSSFFSENRNQTACIEFYPTKKKVFINDVEKKSSSYLSEKFTAVVFSPEDLSLIKAGPSVRRKFIDTSICQQKIKYAVTLSKYNRIINQRNTLLKDISKHKELLDTLSIWDDMLSMLGAVIIKERIDYVKKLSESALKYHKGISKDREDLQIEYVSSCGATSGDSVKDIQKKLTEKLSENRREDLYLGCTNIGAHRDDLDVIINGIKAKTFGSQGQQRSAVLSLKLSEAQLLTQINEEKPIILLDDVLSELDNNRQDFLLNNILDYQVFVTCCEKSNKDQLKEGKIFKLPF